MKIGREDVLRSGVVARERIFLDRQGNITHTRPHTAMGVSKAAGDAITLRDCLAQAGSIPEALARYEKLRRVEGHEITQYRRQLGASFGGEQS
jgi:2-polyprenyl-6-methoxyphenol hydroxylase-like FAD-dependent oxidoreductase